jgi:glutamyl/glutaminyl-tRNA synthetase
MGSLINLSLRVDNCKGEICKRKDGTVYYNFTVSVSDDSNNLVRM